MRLQSAGATRTRLFGAVAAVCVCAVTIAMVSQHRFGLQPCPWCVLQRVVFLAIAIACVAGALIRWRTVRAACAWIAVLLAACGAASALWQHFRAAASASCSLTLADRIISALRLDTAVPDAFEPRASCADAAVSLLGVPYDFWSLGLFVVIALAGLRLARR